MQEIEEEPESNENDWLEYTKTHITLGGGYQGVKIFMTGSSYGAARKWTNTDMHGVLYLIQIKEVQNYPVVMVQLKGTDAAGIERDVVFENELSFNFAFDGNLGPNFSALALMNGEYGGFYFSDRSEKTDFDGKILEL